MDNDNNKEIIKQTSKLALNAALSPIKKYIIAGLLTIIPYIIGGIIIITLFAGIYLNIMEQFDTVANATGDIAERIANASRLYGFKNEAEVSEDEEKKFYKTLDFYKEYYDLTDYDVLLISKTLLFEGMYEDKITFTETIDDDNSEVGLNDFLDGNVFTNIVKMYSTFMNRLYVGFSSAYMGSSQYKKANKQLSEPVIVLHRCHVLTGQSVTTDDVKQCYYGYLVAEYNYSVDKAIEKGTIDPEVKVGYLIFKDLSKYFSFPSDMTTMTDDEIDGMISKISDKIKQFDKASFMSNPFQYIFQRIGAGITLNLVSELSKSMEQLSTALNLLLYGKIADKPNDSVWFNNKHFFYNGYIVRFLREYYKSVPIDYDKIENESEYKQLIEFERKNKRKIADEIFDNVDSYYLLAYGKNYNANSTGGTGKFINYETNSGVEITIDGNKINISFDDYVKLIMYQLYGDSLFSINDQDTLQDMVIRARTIAYQNIGVTKLGATNVLSGDMTELYNNFKEKINNELASKLDKIIKSTTGLVYKDSNGNLVSVGGSIDYINKYVSPLPGNARQYITAYFATTDSVHRTAHSGYDFGYSRGTDVASAAAGEVIAAYNLCDYSTSASNRCGPTGYGGYGNVVVVKSYDLNGAVYYTYYGHMDGGSVIVNVGDKVSPGQLIGKVGSSGSSTGPHLHLEVRYGCDSKSCLIDPLDFFGF